MEKTEKKSKVAIIGLGIMGRRMLKHMRLHPDFEPDFLWDLDKNACELALKDDPNSTIMESATDAIQAADLVYLACPPLVRKPYAIEAARLGKALFLEKPLGVSIEASEDLVFELNKHKIPLAVNFTQAAGIPLTNLLIEKKKWVIW